jgi:aminoglycoside phosphotransferase (APT) family kinase protein
MNGDIVELFAAGGTFLHAERLSTGHINETFVASFRTCAGTSRMILQRINSSVFTDIPALMQNISRVTRHLAGRSLTLVPTRVGGDYAKDSRGGYWRAYEYVENGRTIDVPQTPQQAFEAARAFGDFASRLADLPGPRLNETIPRFHDTLHRFAALRQALRTDAVGRAATAGDEIRFALGRENLAATWDRLRALGVRERAVHNDTKINNVLLSPGGDHRIIDLDTVMPGLLLYDFGDMVRTGAASAPEDERDLRKVQIRPEYYRAIVRGFSEGWGALLTGVERAHFVIAAKTMIFENGIRFLTDYLNGDTYFRVVRTSQNLDRARTQFALVRSLEAGEEQPAT